MFTKSQQDLLKSVGRKSNDPNIGTPNSALEDVMDMLRKENPQAFLRDVDLQERVFVNEPTSNTPLRGYIYSISERV